VLPARKHFAIATRISVTLLLLLATLDASASNGYPEVVGEDLGLAQPPPCTVCHQDENGGEGTATKPFGVTMIRFGVSKGNVPTLRAALQQIQAEGSDSDSDGVPDVEELRSGGDPNDGYTGPLPLTGCSVTSRGRELGAGCGLGVCLIIAFGGVYRRRSRLLPTHRASLHSVDAFRF
jgi:hypothetical protein